MARALLTETMFLIQHPTTPPIEHIDTKILIVTCICINQEPFSKTPTIKFSALNESVLGQKK
jgi:hypothetical protein